MVEKPNLDPKTHQPVPPPQAGQAENAGKPDGYKKGDIQSKPMTFLGMQFTGDESKKLWSIITQNIGREIQKMTDKAVKAIRKLRSAEQGDQENDD